MESYFKKKNLQLYVYYFISLISYKFLDFIPYWGHSLTLNQVMDLYTKLVLMREQLKIQFSRTNKKTENIFFLLGEYL